MLNVLRRLRARLSPPSPEPLMYRVHLFEELTRLCPPGSIEGKRVLEIGPKDGLDTRRLAGLRPSELILMDLPERRETVDTWLPSIPCPVRYLETNFNYVPAAELEALGPFALIWCTGVLYHNAEQLRFLRKLYRLLSPAGVLVLESATLRSDHRHLREGRFVEIHYPDTYRDTGTMTHLPSRGAIKAWLQMVGFEEIHDSRCYEVENRNLVEHRYACLCRKGEDDRAGAYYAKSGLNPAYRYGDAT